MSGKTSTIILKVDLQCRQCYKKIRKTLCKLQDLDGGKIQIRSVVYDEKNDSITISGPFDPKKLLKTICSDAGKAVKDIQIVENKPEPKQVEPPPPEPKPTPPAPASEPVQPTPEPEALPPPVEPEPAPPAPEPTPPAPDPPASEPVPPMPKPDPPAAPAPTPPPEPEPEPPKKVEPEPSKPEPEVKQLNHIYSYPPPVWTPGPMAPGPVCCCKPWYEAYNGGGSKCCSCGLNYGTVSHGPPTPVFYGASIYSGQPTPVIYGESYYGGKPTPVIYGEPYYNGPPTPVTYGGPCYDGPPKQVYGGSSYYNGPNNCQVVCDEEPSCRIM